MMSTITIKFNANNLAKFPSTEARKGDTIIFFAEDSDIKLNIFDEQLFGTTFSGTIEKSGEQSFVVAYELATGENSREFDFSAYHKGVKRCARGNSPIIIVIP